MNYADFDTTTISSRKMVKKESFATAILKHVASERLQERTAFLSVTGH